MTVRRGGQEEPERPVHPAVRPSSSGDDLTPFLEGDPIRPAKKKRDAGETFATIATGTLLGGALAVVCVLIVWLIVWLIHALPWS